MIRLEFVNRSTARRYQDNPYDDEGRLDNWRLLLKENSRLTLHRLAVVDDEIRRVFERCDANKAISIHELDVAGFQYWRLVALIRGTAGGKSHPFIFLGSIVRYLGEIKEADREMWIDEACKMLVEAGLMAPMINRGRLYHTVGRDGLIVAASSVIDFVIAHATPDMTTDTIVYA